MKNRNYRKPGRPRHGRECRQKSPRKVMLTRQEIQDACREAYLKISALIQNILHKVQNLDRLSVAIKQALHDARNKVRGVVRIREKKDGLHAIVTVFVNILDGIAPRPMTVDVLKPLRA